MQRVERSELNLLQAKLQRVDLACHTLFGSKKYIKECALTSFSRPNRMLKIKTKGTFNCVRDRIEVRTNCL